MEEPNASYYEIINDGLAFMKARYDAVLWFGVCQHIDEISSRHLSTEQKSAFKKLVTDVTLYYSTRGQLTYFMELDQMLFSLCVGLGEDTFNVIYDWLRLFTDDEEVIK